MAVVKSVDKDFLKKDELSNDFIDNDFIDDDEDAILPTFETLIKEGVEIPDELPKVVRVDIKEAGFLLTPIDENRTEFSFICTADPHLSYVPTYLINWGIKFSSGFAFQTFKTTSMKVNDDKIFQDRMRERSDVYEYMRKRLIEHSSSKKQDVNND